MISLPPLIVAGLLAVAAVVLVGPGPSWVARWTFLRQVPRAAVTLWQAGAIAALICVLGVAWLLLRHTLGRPDWVWVVAAVAVLFAAVVVGRLGWALVQVVGSTGARRRRHRDLVDLLATGPGELATRTPGLRVLAEAQPLAYCLPGLLRSRVVLSEGTLAMLSPAELSAVLAHETAHLRARHDVVLATFDAVHQAFPHAIRSDLPAQQSRLLVEMLADDAAVRAVGRAPLGRAMLALSGSVVPDGGLGAGPANTRVRLERLTDQFDRRDSGWLSAAVYALALALVLTPVFALLAAL